MSSGNRFQDQKRNLCFIEYTWSGHKIIDIFKSVLLLLITVLLTAMIGSLLELLGFSLVRSGSDTLLLILFFICFGVSVVFSLFTTDIWLDSISSCLYIRLILKTKVSLTESMYLRFFFTPNKTKRWYPMEELKEVAAEDRREQLLRTAKEILAHNANMFKKLLPFEVKAMEVLKEIEFLEDISKERQGNLLQKINELFSKIRYIGKEQATVAIYCKRFLLGLLAAISFALVRYALMTHRERASFDQIYEVLPLILGCVLGVVFLPEVLKLFLDAIRNKK